MDQSTYTRFYATTGFNVDALLDRFIAFGRTQQSSIIRYYEGSTTDVPTRAFVELDALRDEIALATELLRTHRTVLSKFSDWELLEQLETAADYLETTQNANRFLRSGIRRGGEAESEYTFTLDQGETLEEFSRRRLGATNSDDQWTEVAKRNRLNEEKYTPSGGVLLKATLQQGNPLRLSSVLDYITGENALGIDLDQRLQFVDGDLKVLSPQETFEQAINILAQLSQGDNPEYPLHGTKRSLLVGSSIGSVTYPSLFRQLAATFSNDDTVKSFAIRDIRRQQDAVFIDYDVETRLSDVQPFTFTY